MDVTRPASLPGRSSCASPCAAPGLPRRAVSVPGPGAAVDTRLMGSPPSDTPRASDRAEGLTAAARGARSLCAPVMPAVPRGPHELAPMHTQSTPEARGTRPGRATAGPRAGPPGCNTLGSVRGLAPQGLAPNASPGSSYDRASSSGPYRPLDTAHNAPRPAVSTHGRGCCGRLVVGAAPVWPGQHRSLLDAPGPG